MYQYAFMPTFILNIETLDSENFVELPPYVWPLKTFMPQEEYDEEWAIIRKAIEVCFLKFASSVHIYIDRI